MAANRRLLLSPLDLGIVLGVMGGLIFILLRLKSGMVYNWEWGAIPQYLVRYNAQTGAMAPGLLLKGFLMTLRLSLWASLLALVLGIVGAFSRLSKNRLARSLGTVYVAVVRNLPPLILVFIVYFFLLDQFIPSFGVEQFIKQLSPWLQRWLTILAVPPALMSSFIAAVLTLALYEGAYITEIIRGGVQSIHSGQWEAAQSLGLPRRRVLRLVILPQAMGRILPPLAGQFVSTIKDSAIVSVISIQELTFRGMELMAATFLTFEIWITITILYFLLTFLCSLAVGYLERRMGHR